MKKTTRRKFIKQTCGAIAYTSLFSSLINLKAFAAAANDNSLLDTSNYKAVVMLMLDGGNDSFNMLVPKGNAEYAEYHNTRSNLSIPQNDLIGINPLPLTSDGKQYGLNPVLSGMQNMFETNRLAFLSNVGTLTAPMTKTQYNNHSVDRPLGLFSHLDQRQHWQTGRPNERTHRGWGGRMADLLGDMNTNENISMNISLNGINTFQYGEEIIPYVITADGAISITDWDSQDPFNITKHDALNSLMDLNYNDIYKDTYKNTLKASNETALYFQEIIDALPDFSTPMPVDNHLAKQFRMVAKIMQARNTFGFVRQTFYVQLGGWDHHAELLHNHGLLLGKVDEAISYFNSLLEEIDLVENVITFNASDFGRTLTSNGNGSDHAWGGNIFMMGGPVIGKNIFGTYPSLDLSGPQSLHSRGVMLPTTPTDKIFAEIAKWFGVSNSDLNYIFPNLSNFYDTTSGIPPIGFLT